MKREVFEDFSFKDDIEIMNLEHQMKTNQMSTNNQNIGFNTDFLYNNVEQNMKNEKKW